MNSTYIVNEWALIHRNEMVDIPDKLEIHPDFLKIIDYDDFECAFRHIGAMFYQIYTDIAESPERFSMPMYKTGEVGYGSKEAGMSRKAALNIFYFLLSVFKSGELENNHFIVNVALFKEINRIKNLHKIMEALSEYGFSFVGLKDYKITPNVHSFEVEYPDLSNVLVVFSLIAKKVYKTQCADGNEYFANSFISWNYRILKEDLDTVNFGFQGDFVADKMHNCEDKEFPIKFNEIMEGLGYVHKREGWNEGPGICYYDKQSVMDKKGPYLYRMLSWKGDLQLLLRIRSAKKCIEYANTCPENIKNMFRHSDTGCNNRINGTCNKGVQYVFEEQERWHCGCCCAAFQLHPCIEDIPYYLKLVELGVSK